MNTFSFVAKNSKNLKVVRFVADSFITQGIDVSSIHSNLTSAKPEITTDRILMGNRFSNTGNQHSKN